MFLVSQSKVITRMSVILIYECMRMQRIIRMPDYCNRGDANKKAASGWVAAKERVVVDDEDDAI